MLSTFSLRSLKEASLSRIIMSVVLQVRVIRDLLLNYLPIPQRALLTLRPFRFSFLRLWVHPANVNNLSIFYFCKRAGVSILIRCFLYLRKGNFNCLNWFSFRYLTTVSTCLYFVGSYLYIYLNIIIFELVYVIRMN